MNKKVMFIIRGYSKMFERMLNHPNIKIMLNTDFKEVISIDFENKKNLFLRTGV
jgi:UDP-galactopyranose mutase